MGADRVDPVVAAVLVITVAATGYLLVLGFTDPGRLLAGGGSQAARVLSCYESVRTVVLLGAAVWLLLRKRRRALCLVLVLNAITQAGDAVVGIAARHSAADALGPACFAAALAYAAWRLGRRPAPGGSRGSGSRDGGGRDGGKCQGRREGGHDPRRQALLMGGPRFKRARPPR
jgi:hypothetical protein